MQFFNSTLLRLSFQNGSWENSLCFEWISYDNIINSVLRPAFWNCMSTFGFIYLFCNECIQVRCSCACVLLIFMCLCPFWPHQRTPPTSLSWNRLILPAHEYVCNMHIDLNLVLTFVSINNIHIHMSHPLHSGKLRHMHFNTQRFHTFDISFFFLHSILELHIYTHKTITFILCWPVFLSANCSRYTSQRWQLLSLKVVFAQFD